MRSFRALARLNPEGRILLSVIVLLGLSIGGVAYLSYRLLKADLETLQAGQQFSAATLMAHRIEDALHDQINALEKLTVRLVENDRLMSSERMRTVLDERFLLHNYFNAGLIVMDKTGTAIADSPKLPGRAGTSYGDRPHIQQVLKEGKPVISPPVMGKVTKAPAMSISVPVKNRQGETIGLVQGVINLSKSNFLNEVGQHSYGQSGGYLIIDRTTRLFVAATDKNLIMQRSADPGINAMHDRYMSGFEGSGIRQQTRNRGAELG